MKQLAVSIMMRVGGTLLALAVSSVLARLLGPNGFGTYTLIIAVVGLASLPFHAGTYVLISREASRALISRDFPEIKGLVQSVTRYAIFSGSVLIVTALVALWLSMGALPRYTIAAVVMIPLIALDRFRSALLQGFHYPLVSQTTELIVRPATFITLIFAIGLVDSVDVDSAVEANLISLTVALIIGWVLARARFPSGYREARGVKSLRKWLPALVPLSALSAFQQVNGQVDVLILGWRSAAYEVGLYKGALQLSTLIIFLQTAILAVIASKLSEKFSLGDLKALEIQAKRTSAIIFALSIPVCLMLILFGRFALTTIFGQSYEDAYTALLILVVAQAFNVFGGVALLTLKMCGYETQALRWTVVAFFLNLITAMLLAERYGSVGVALAAAVAAATLNISLHWRLMRTAGINVLPVNMFNSK